MQNINWQKTFRAVQSVRLILGSLAFSGLQQVSTSVCIDIKEKKKKKGKKGKYFIFISWKENILIQWFLISLIEHAFDKQISVDLTL